MKTVYKYSLEVAVCTIELPEGSTVVCVHEQNLVPTIWVEQETGKLTKDYMFCVVPTGGQAPEDGRHIGTCFIGPNVWHVYQKV